MGVSDRIETFIIELLKNEDNLVEIGRNELASIFDCVPSQINYVISTRFSPERGYFVESRRGGGGCLRIRRIEAEDEISHVLNAIGDVLDFKTMKSMVDYLYSNKKLSMETVNVILSGLSDRSLMGAGEMKNKIRAVSFKNMILSNN